MSVDLSVLIVHYYTEDLLPGLIGSLRNLLSDRFSEVLIWDNGSRNGKPNGVTAPCPLIWLQSSANVGFAKGHNGLAQRAKGRRFLIINPDAQFVSGGLERLWRTAEENPQAGITAPRIQFPDGRLQVSVFPPYTFGFDWRKSFWLEHATILSEFQRETVRKLTEAKEPFSVGWASGACMLVFREVWEKVGGFDPQFFFGGEDADFCRRVREAGWEVLCEPRALLAHQAGQSLEREPERKVLYYYQKRLYYAHKNFSRIQFDILWITSVLELAGKWGIGLLLSFTSERWKKKRDGYAGALALIFSGRWKKSEGLVEKQALENRKTAEAAI